MDINESLGTVKKIVEQAQGSGMFKSLRDAVYVSDCIMQLERVVNEFQALKDEVDRLRIEKDRANLSS